MPIRFQCPTCEGTLSIARRKAGSQVLCPKCEDIITVPEEDESDVELADSTAGATAAGPTAAVAKPPPSSTKARKPADLPPLEEMDDIEELLDDSEPQPEPAVAKRTVPLPLPPQPIPNAVPDEGILISRQVAIVLGIVMAALLALAFITGFLIGR